MTISLAEHSQTNFDEVAIGLGSNLGDRLANLTFGVESILAFAHEGSSCSSLYETQAVNCPEPHPFLNAVLIFRTHLEPTQILDRLLHIEASAGRIRAYPNSPRCLDLDLLYCGQNVCQSPTLTLPHPRLIHRLFVLEPLAEIRPRWIHPVLRQSATQLLTQARISHRDQSVVRTMMPWPIRLPGARENSA